MAKDKKDNLNEDVTLNGQAIDPEIQKRVEQYMDLEVSDESEVPQADTDTDSVDAEISEPEPAAAVEPASEVATAPLLPTEELPDSVKNAAAKPKAKAKSIEVKEHIEPEEVTEPQPPVSEEAVEEPLPEEVAADEPQTEPEADLTAEADTQEESDVEAEADVETVAEPVSEEPGKTPVDADALAAPDFKEKPEYADKTIGELQDAALPLDDPETAQAIDEIIAADADMLLGIEDKKKHDAPVVAALPPKPKKQKNRREGNFFSIWFKTPLYRNLTILAAVGILAAVAAFPPSRYFLLNKSGVRVSASVRVLDEKTQQPLKNVEFNVDGKSVKTDGDGNAKVTGIRLGKQKVVIKKPAFSEVIKDLTMGWGSNPLGDFALTPVGAQYTFVITDFLSGKPVTDGELNYEEASARINGKGEAIITIPNIDEQEIPISITAGNYRSETVRVTTSKQEKYELKMVPARKDVFFSKRSGKIDLYQTDVDGKNQQVILSGSGIEKEDSLGIAPHPVKNIVAFTASRENVRNQDGFLLNTLEIINLDTREITKIAQSERIQIINWAGDRLIYVKIAQGASKADPSRTRLMSYDTASKTEKELASTNYFNDVLSVDGAIYYSPALYKVNGTVGLYKINADGSNKKTIFQKEVWNLFRTSFDKVSLSVGQDWYELDLTNDSLVKVGGAPSVLKSRVYIKSPDGKNYLWIDERDGKTVLVEYNQDSGKDKVIQTQSGIKNPVRWLDSDHVVYRVASGDETADYVISLSGGEPKKIVDVMNSYGIDRWYYF